MHENLHNHVVLFFFLLLLFIFHPVKSEIQTIKIRSDSRPFIHFEDFGFNNPGFISISISSISIKTKSVKQRNSSLMGCFYAPDPARRTLKSALFDDYCIIGKPYIFPIFIFNERSIRYQASVNKTIPVNIPDLYYIFFVNCVKNSTISMNVNIETFNIKPNGDPDYIDEHLDNLPSTLLTFAFLFFFFLLIWTRLCLKNKPFVHNIHMLMGLLLFLRFLDFLFYAKSLRSIRLTGSPHGWTVLWLAIYFARNVFFVTVIVLIGAGWSLLRPRFQEFQKFVLGVAVTLQILSSLCFILMRGIGTANKNYRYWVLTYYAVDFICCIVTLLPVYKSIDDLTLNLKVEGKKAKKLAHLRVYGNYALAIYAYIGFTKLGMFVLRCITSYKFMCVTIALELAIELLFYIVVYLMFWPNERNDYAVLVDREEEQPSFSPRHGSRTVF